jgi:hypothetical protein
MTSEQPKFPCPWCHHDMVEDGSAGAMIYMRCKNPECTMALKYTYAIQVNQIPQPESDESNYLTMP